MFSSLLQISEVPFRIDDFLAIAIVSSVIWGMGIHFIREVIYGRRGKRWDMVFEQVERYDKVQIVIHWLFLILLTALLITGLIIFKLDYLTLLYPPLGEVGLRNLAAYHWYFAVVLIQLGLIHILYDTFIIRKFRDAWITQRDLQSMKTIAKNFFVLTEEYPRLEKLHPLQKMAHWGIFVVVFLLGVTGLTVWEPFLGLIRALGLGYFEPWLYIYNSRYLHDILTFVLVALMIGHFYFSVLIPTNWKIFRGIIYGKIKYDTSKKHTDK